MTSDSVASPTHGKRRRWVLFLIGLLGSWVLFGAITGPWLRSWTFSSERIESAPPSLTVFDFGVWGYGYVLGLTGLAVLVITAWARPGACGRRFLLVTVAAGAIGLASFLVINWQIDRYEIAARTRWSDVLWAVQQRNGAYSLKFYRDGLGSGTIALYLLGVGALLAFSPRERFLKVLAAGTSFALVLWILLPWRIKWITDATALEYHYQFALTAGPAAYLLAATTAALALLLTFGAHAAVSRRWVLPWLTTVAVLVVVGLGMGITLDGASPSTTEDFEQNVDVEFTELDGPKNLALLALLLVLFVAVPIARAWRHTARERGQFQPADSAMLLDLHGQDELVPSLETVPIATALHRTEREREPFHSPEAMTSPGPRRQDQAPRPSSWSRRRVVVASGAAAVIVSVVSASLKEDEAAKTAKMCSNLESAIEDAVAKTQRAMTASPGQSGPALREGATDLRAAAGNTDNQDIVTAIFAVADELEQAALGDQADPQSVSEVLDLLDTMGDECGSPTAR